MTSPRLSPLLDFFFQLYSYREYMKQSVLRDLRNKYKRSALGYLWTMLHPLGMMAILAIVFSNVMRLPIKDYAVFLFTGLLVWNYFSGTTVMSLGNIRGNARLIGQLAVPKYLFLVSISISNLVNLLLAIIPLVLIMLILGRELSWTVLAFPLVLLPLYLFTLAVAMILATSNVFFDDTLHLTEVGLQAIYFLSPILYAREMLPIWLRDWVVVNPLVQQIEFMRALFYYNQLPDIGSYLLNCLISLVVFALALKIFRKAEDKFLYFI